MLELKEVSKSFGQKKVLDQLSVLLPPGTLALLGPNGAGKTTLLRMILELYRCKQGKLIWNGDDVTNKGIIPAHAGYLPQKFGVLPNLTCHEMLEYFAILKNIPREKRKEEIERCIEFVHLSDRAKNRCGSLSGGMVRRLGIAQALLGDPQLLLFDEPTTGLDPEERLRFKLLVHQMSESSHRTILISTHIVDDIEALCDRIVVMDGGKVIANHPSRVLAERAKDLVWQVPKPQGDKLPDGAYIRALRQMPEGDMLLVLSEIPIGKPVAPTVEDGYLCCLKGIGAFHAP
ncbi:MAG: ATP-binding cassette domain-containing protein [Fusicatenibacter sp.]